MTDTPRRRGRPPKAYTFETFLDAQKMSRTRTGFGYTWARHKRSDASVRLPDGSERIGTAIGGTAEVWALDSARVIIAMSPVRLYVAQYERGGDYLKARRGYTGDHE